MYLKLGYLYTSFIYFEFRCFELWTKFHSNDFPRSVFAFQGCLQFGCEKADQWACVQEKTHRTLVFSQLVWTLQKVYTPPCRCLRASEFRLRIWIWDCLCNEWQWHGRIFGLVGYDALAGRALGQSRRGCARERIQSYGHSETRCRGSGRDHPVQRCQECSPCIPNIADVFVTFIVAYLRKRLWRRRRDFLWHEMYFLFFLREQSSD